MRHWTFSSTFLFLGRLGSTEGPRAQRVKRCRGVTPPPQSSTQLPGDQDNLLSLNFWVRDEHVAPGPQLAHGCFSQTGKLGSLKGPPDLGQLQFDQSPPEGPSGAKAVHLYT